MDTEEIFHVVKHGRPKPPIKKVKTRPTPLTVENHPQSPDILQALVNGESAMAISRWAKPFLDPKKINKFRKERLSKALQDNATLPVTMAQALQQRGLLPDNEEVAEVVGQMSAVQAANDPLLSRIRRNYSIIDNQLAKEVSKEPEKRSAGAICALISTDLKAIEVEAKLTGRMDGPRQGITINIITPHSPRGDMHSPIVEIGERK